MFINMDMYRKRDEEGKGNKNFLENINIDEQKNIEKSYEEIYIKCTGEIIEYRSEKIIDALYSAIASPDK